MCRILVGWSGKRFMKELFKCVSITGGEIVLGRESMNYQRVLDDFVNAKKVRILTYNISKNQYRNELINALKKSSG